MAELHSEVGGKEQFEPVFKWPASDLCKAEIDAYSTRIDLEPTSGTSLTFPPGCKPP